MLRTIIIDDEAHQRLTIEKMAEYYCPTIKVVAKADSVQSGLKAIKKHKPDLVLLDIKLGDGTGFDILEQLQLVDFKVIFITAFDDYAIKAFRCSALDYLLKPLDPDELVQAVNKTGEVRQKDFINQLENLKKLLTTADKEHKKVVVKTHDNIYLIAINEIIYCQSDNNYITFYLINKEQIVVSASLKDYEEILSDTGFFRVHKSYLINLGYVRRFEKADGGFVVLEGGQKIPVSHRKRVELLGQFGWLSQT